MISLTVCMWYWKINNEEDRMVININIIKKEASPQINALQIFEITFQQETWTYSAWTAKERNECFVFSNCKSCLKNILACSVLISK